MLRHMLGAIHLHTLTHHMPRLTTCLIPYTFPCNAQGMRLVAYTPLRGTHASICATAGRVNSLSHHMFGTPLQPMPEPVHTRARFIHLCHAQLS